MRACCAVDTSPYQLRATQRRARNEETSQHRCKNGGRDHVRWRLGHATRLAGWALLLCASVNTSRSRLQGQHRSVPADGRQQGTAVTLLEQLDLLLAGLSSSENKDRAAGPSIPHLPRGTRRAASLVGVHRGSCALVA